MRKSLVLAMIAVLACSSLALAGVPDPARSGCGFGNGATTCQYRFLADGSGDAVTVCVTLRDAFDTPVASCSTSVTLTGVTGGTSCLCATGTSFPIRLTAFSDGSGIAKFTLASPTGIGGHGTLDAALTTHCAGAGNIEICVQNVPYTSPELDGSCLSNGGLTDVFDLGAWAGGLPPAYKQEADYTCDGIVDVFDLGFWAGGLTVACP